MEFKELFKEDNLISQIELSKVYFHYIGDIKDIYDSLGKVSLVVNSDKKPVFLYTVQAGGKIGDQYLFPTLNNLQLVTNKEFNLYVKGSK